MFGLDLVCGDDLDPSGAEIDPDSPESVVQEILHRLDMARGTLVHDDEDAGLAVSNWSSREMTPAELAALPGALKAEALKARPRVQDVSLSIERLDSSSVRVAMVVELASGATFPLTVDITRAGALLVGAN